MIMKNILLKLINFYQSVPFTSHGKCKYYPTCSQYAKEAINEYGALKGTILSIKRIIRCNPLSKGGYDPVKRRYYEKN